MTTIRASITMLLIVSTVACVGVSVRKNDEASPPPHGVADRPSAALLAGTVQRPGEIRTEPVNSYTSRTAFDVTYHNDTKRTLASVEIWCRGYDAAGWIVGARRWTIDAVDYGPIQPGFRTRRTLSIDHSPDTSVVRVTCELTQTD